MMRLGSKKRHIAAALLIICTLAQPVSADAETKVVERSEATKEANLLKGTVTHESKQSPLLYGSIQTLPPGTTINLVSLVNLNAEFRHQNWSASARSAFQISDWPPESETK